VFRTQFSSHPREAKECFRPVCVGSIMAHAGLVFHGGCLQIAVKLRFELVLTRLSRCPLLLDCPTSVPRHATSPSPCGGFILASLDDDIVIRTTRRNLFFNTAFKQHLVAALPARLSRCPLSTIVPTESLEQGYRAGTDRNAKAGKAFSTLPAILFPDRV
jgi:hypothetical protein